MCDIFTKKEARRVLANKHVAIIGGSNMRGLYKDIIWLLNDNSFIPREVLGEKLEKHFPDFNGPKWTIKKISGRIKKKFEGNQDIRLQNEGTYIHDFSCVHLKNPKIKKIRNKTKIKSKI